MTQEKILKLTLREAARERERYKKLSIENPQFAIYKYKAKAKREEILKIKKMLESLREIVKS